MGKVVKAVDSKRMEWLKRYLKIINSNTEMQSC